MIRFVVNLRPETADPIFRRSLAPRGYLLAPNNATGPLRALARAVTRAGYPLVSDNGNFVSIGRVSSQFASEASRLHQRVTALEQRLGRSITGAEVPPDLRKEYELLARGVITPGRLAMAADPVRITAQQSLGPTDLIGAEDLTGALWLRLSIEPTYTGFEARELDRFNRQVAKRARAEMATLSASLRAHYYPVASAMDYRTAFNAGRIFGGQGLSVAAMGFGAFMADDNYADTVRIGKRTVRLGGRVPQRYLRTVAVARGYWDGYRAEVGRAPTAFHFLGLGAPIMMALAALIARGTQRLTFDAMSPILDAVQGTLYVAEPALLKLRARSIARRLATDPAHRWDCPCGFCRRFTSHSPFDYRLGQRWGQRLAPGGDVTQADLRPGGGLFGAFPFLSEPSGTPLRAAVSNARAGHNHWVLDRLAKRLDRARKAGKLIRLIREIGSSYDQNADSEPAKRAIRFGVQLATGELGP